MIVSFDIIGSDDGLSLYGSKTLSELMLAYCYLDLWEQILVDFESKYNGFPTRKYISKSHPQNGI